MAARVGVRRWVSLVAVIWLQSINGTNSNFPAYSSQLKQMMAISQLQLNNLAFASDAGKLLGWLSGIAALYLPLWLVLLLGSFIGLLGYGLQYLFLTGQMKLSYVHVFLLTVLSGNSICWINTVCYAVIISSFAARSRQVAVGLTASYQGLTANIYTDIVDVVAPAPSMLARRAKAYLLLNSILPAIVSVATAHFVGDNRSLRYDYHHNSHNNNSDGGGGAFGVLFAITIATGVYAVVSSLGTISANISSVYNVVGIGLLLMAPLVIPLAEGIRRSRLGLWWVNRQQGIQIHDLPMSELKVVDDNDHLERAVREAKDEVMLGSGDSDNCRIGTVREELGVREMLRRMDFWLYFFVYMFGATLGMVYLNNLGQITESRGSTRTSSLVSLASAYGFFGRLLPSLLDYLFSRQEFMVSRPACVAALMAPMTGSFFLLLNSSNPCLYISTSVIGICTGAITSISVSMTTELFGTKNFSVNHNIVVANIPIGSFIFGYLAAVLYRKEGNVDGKCIGMECYRISFIIWGSLCFLGTNLALLLHARSRNFYSRGLAGKS